MNPIPQRRKTDRPGHQAVLTVMQEHIRLPGAPQIIVSRAWAYNWLRKLGYDGTRYGSRLDSLVFGAEAVDDPLTDLEDPGVRAFIEDMERMERGEQS